mmetsp:Transcript_21970/g.50695  ORF Transcript_21970/g.50695 Transcript_21970/m.50695 type:complete len:111 (-) Transcript_21970:117-449(-)
MLSPAEKNKKIDTDIPQIVHVECCDDEAGEISSSSLHCEAEAVNEDSFLVVLFVAFMRLFFMQMGRQSEIQQRTLAKGARRSSCVPTSHHNKDTVRRGTSRIKLSSFPSQ